jgi:hypothetical protein
VKATSGTQITKGKNVPKVIEYDPDTHERKISMGPLRGESKLDFLKRVLVRYQELYGDMHVAALFDVP